MLSSSLSSPFRVMRNTWAEPLARTPSRASRVIENNNKRLAHYEDPLEFHQSTTHTHTVMWWWSWQMDLDLEDIVGATFVKFTGISSSSWLSQPVDKNLISIPYCNRFFSFGATGKKKSIVAVSSGVSGLSVGNMQQLNLGCGGGTIARQRRGSVGERSLSGSPPDHPPQPVSVAAATTSLILASSSATTAAASAGINSNPASSGSGTTTSAPSDECDTPYRYNFDSFLPTIITKHMYIWSRSAFIII